MRTWWRHLGRCALPHWRGLGLIGALMLVQVGLDVLRPWPLKLIIDNVLGGDELPEAASWIARLPWTGSAAGQIAWLCGGTVLLFTGTHLVGAAQSYLRAGVGTRMVYDLGARLFDHLQRLSIVFHGRRDTGDLVRRVVTDSDCVRGLIVGVALPLVTAVATLTAMFLVMWRLDRSLALLSVLIAPVLGGLMKRFERPMTDRNYAVEQTEGERAALAEQVLTAVPMVQAYGQEARETERFRRIGERGVVAHLKAVGAQLRFTACVTATTAAGRGLVIVVGGLHVLEGSLSVGSLIVFLSYLGALYAPLENIAFLSAGFASAAAKARRTVEVLAADEAVPEAPDAVDLPAAGRGHIRFESVSFGYDPGRPVLQGVDLEALPGDTVALVGPSGAGKTTLASLIPRFHDPWEGRILLDGVDLRRLKLHSLREGVGFVLQDPFLMPVTVAENIAYGKPGALRPEIVAAAEAANADAFIREMDHGYDTLIGERGETLSGGQRQRLAIARALLKNAPLLIMDEPTAALDAETERAVMEAVSRLVKGRTTFIIAHRLSTVRQATRIVVLDEGRIQEVGTHDELLAAGGLYSRLQALQTGRQERRDDAAAAFAHVPRGGQ